MNEPRTEKNNLPKKQDDIASQVAATLMSVTGCKVDNFEADLKNMGIDSMTMLDALAALETRFEVVLNENMLKEFDSINRIARIIDDVVRASSD